MPLTGGPWVLPAMVVTALAAGLLKGQLVLGKATARTTERIAGLGELGRLHRIGAAIGLKALLLVVLMMLMGYLVRHSGWPPPLRGWLCLAVGFALLWGSRAYWRLVIGDRLTNTLCWLVMLLWLLLLAQGALQGLNQALNGAGQ